MATVDPDPILGSDDAVVDSVDKCHSSLKSSPWLSQILCRMQQAVTRVGRNMILVSFYFMIERHLPFNLPKAFSTTHRAQLKR